MSQKRPTRFVPPSTADAIILRQRLFDLLGRRQTTVVSGAAGYGKSCLISSWLATTRPGGAVGWLTLAAAHADAGRFCADLLGALREAADDEVPALLSLESPPLTADPLRIIDAINEGFYETDAAVTLVLDDIHHLNGSDGAVRALDHFLQWAPSSIQIVLSGRSLPRLRLQRLRLDERLDLIGHPALAFTRAETGAAISALGLVLSAREVRALHEVTQGWPAAVRLAALALKEGGTDGFLQGLGREDALADYLTTEVLGAVDEPIRNFLLSATFDEVVCPSLVNTVCGSSGAGGLLDRCAADGLFLTREYRPDPEPWFRWHSLFAAQMRERRAHEDPDGCRELDLRAARWWRDVDPQVAVGHALAGGDFDLAGAIFASAWLGLVLDGHSDTVVSLAESFPAELAYTAEVKLALAFIAAQAGRSEEALAHMAIARRAAHRLDEVARARFDVRATVIQLFLVDDRASLVDAVEAATGMYHSIGDGPWTADTATIALVGLFAGMGHARLQRDMRLALGLLGAAADSARTSGLKALELTAYAETCMPLISEGDLEVARLLAERVLADADTLGWTEMRSLAPAYGYLGWLAMWQGDTRRAQESLERSLSLLLPVDWGMRGLLLMTLAETCLLAGRLEDAEAAAGQAHSLAVGGRMPPWWPSVLNALDATIAMARGDRAEAVRRASAPDSGPEFGLVDCLRARVLLLDGQPQACLDLVMRIPVEWRFPHLSVFREVLSVRAYEALGYPVEAQDALERALGAASPSMLMTPFLITGPGMDRLLRKRMRLGTAYPELVPKVLHRISAGGVTTVNQWGETLTERELTILRYLATNLSSREIAAQEFISLNTIKTHIAHIYRKLGAVNRRAALQRAKELGLT